MSRAEEAERMERVGCGQDQDPPVLWVAVEERHAQQMCGYVNRLCLGGMRKRDRSLMRAKERLVEWDRFHGLG